MNYAAKVIIIKYDIYLLVHVYRLIREHSVQCTRIQDACDHARDDDQPERKKLEVSSQNATSFSM